MILQDTVYGLLRDTIFRSIPCKNVWRLRLDGGVYEYGGSFTMIGGKISGNTATGSGGGIYTNKNVEISGGEISGNNALICPQRGAAARGSPYPAAGLCRGNSCGKTPPRPQPA